MTYTSLILSEIAKKVKQNSSEKKFLLLSLYIYDILLCNRFESVKRTLNIRRNWRINAVTRF